MLLRLNNCKSDSQTKNNCKPVSEHRRQAATSQRRPGNESRATVPGGIIEMILPALGENIEKGTVTKILVKAGDILKKGQNILEIETDKAVLRSLLQLKV